MRRGAIMTMTTQTSATALMEANERDAISRSSEGLAAGRGRLRGDRQDRAVGRPQELARGLLNQLRRHLAELVVQAVDAAGIVVEQREGRQEVGAAEPDLALVFRVEPRALLH